MAKLLRYAGAGLMLAVAVLYFRGYAQPPTTWWYPFINSLFSDYYTTGPFAMTSNTREDNPIWRDIAGFNLAQARLTYAMSRGVPETQIAWLYPEGEWADSPGAIGGTPDPNAAESVMSKALVDGGYSYDRISRRDLINASAAARQLQVGAGRYQALLIDNLPTAEPALLASVVELARRGVPVLWHGTKPTRAAGWADFHARDKEITALVELLNPVITSVDPDNIAAVLSSVSVEPTLSALDGTAMRLRIQGRIVEGGRLVLLFNEHADLRSAQVAPSAPFSYAELLNPESGELRMLTPNAGGALELAVPPRRTRLLYLHDDEAEDCPASVYSCFDMASWQQPARSMHPYIRWWWPGNAVEKRELREELGSIHRAGFGGVELQTLTIGLPQRHLEKEQERIYQVGGPAYLDNVKAVMVEAEHLGMTVDLTLGSGWSSGGPFIDEFPEQQLLMSSIDVTGPNPVDVPLPPAQEPFYVTPTNWVIKNTLGEFDNEVDLQMLLAAKIDSGTAPPTLSEFIDISASVVEGRVQWQAPEGDYRLMAIYQNNTAHNVAASAYKNGIKQSPVVDHLDPGGAREYIRDLGQPWLDALQPYRPNALFVDSFELIGELPWSSVFFDTFHSMHGYDVRLYLPLLFKQRGESKYVNVVVPPEPAYQGMDNRAERIREDYESTREHLFQEGFLRPLKRWSAKQGVKLRVQAHGGYGDYLDSYKIADIPESEGLFASGSYDFLKLASSAGHVAGRRFISSESFIMLTLDYNALTLEDYYLLAGNAFSAGINRTIYHGYAYHYAY